MSDEYTVVMESDEYGRETFTYDSIEEAHAGMERLREAIVEQADGIVRTIDLVCEGEEDDDGTDE